MACRSDELHLGARGPGELVVHHVPQRGAGGVVVTERVQPVVVVRVSQAVLDEREYGQRDQEHGERRTMMVGHGARDSCYGRAVARWGSPEQYYGAISRCCAAARTGVGFASSDVRHASTRVSLRAMSNERRARP